MKSFFEYLLEKAEYQAQPDESEVVHHASDHDFTEFHPLSHFGTSNAARARAVFNIVTASRPKNLYTARIKLGKVAHIVDDGNDHTPEYILHGLHDAGHITSNHYDKTFEKMKNTPSVEGRKKIVLDTLKKRKINTIIYKNRIEDPGSNSYIITHPSQVRILSRSTSRVNVRRGRAKLK